jgi:tRNA A-37 threonylcarbamoyl transferase component Bud32
MNAPADDRLPQAGEAAPTHLAQQPVEDDASENTATPPMQADSPAARESSMAIDDSGEVERGLILRNRYVLEEVIGRGGTSIVFRARDLHRASTEDGGSGWIAVKLLRNEWRADPLAIERLRREFRQMQSLSHAGIVRVFDLDCDGEVWFMTMELIAGRTVKQWMRESFERADALRVIKSCCDALEHAHEFGFLHGDLKPTNVLVADDGTVKLIDFGSAPSPGSRIAAQSNAVLAATALYASPQVLAGKAGDVRDDVFSLACLSYGVLSGGKHPFGRRPSLEDGRAKSAPTPLTSIPAALFAVIERALSGDGHDRHESVQSFRSALTDAAAHVQPEVMAGSVTSKAAATVLELRQAGAESATARLRVGVPRPVVGGGRRGTWPVVNFAFLVLAVIVTALLFRPETRRAVMPRAAGATVPHDAGIMAANVPPADTWSGAPAPVEEAGLEAVRGSGVISFAESTVYATAMQPLVAVSVKREHAHGPGAFIWRVDGGTAYPGVDYKEEQPQLVRFLDGQKVRTLFIPLINTRATHVMSRPRSFTVELQPVAGGPAVGRLDRVTVTIEPATPMAHPAMYQARAEQ